MSHSNWRAATSETSAMTTTGAIDQRRSVRALVTGLCVSLPCENFQMKRMRTTWPITKMAPVVMKR